MPGHLQPLASGIEISLLQECPLPCFCSECQMLTEGRVKHMKRYGLLWFFWGNSEIHCFVIIFRAKKTTINHPQSITIFVGINPQTGCLLHWIYHMNYCICHFWVNPASPSVVRLYGCSVWRRWQFSVKPCDVDEGNICRRALRWLKACSVPKTVCFPFLTMIISCTIIILYI